MSNLELIIHSLIYVFQGNIVVSYKGLKLVIGIQGLLIEIGFMDASTHPSYLAGERISDIQNSMISSLVPEIEILREDSVALLFEKRSKIFKFLLQFW